MTAYRCIVVDDEPLARLRITELIDEAGGFDVVALIGDPNEALERIVREPPDVVFLDVRMPGMDGIALLHEVRARVDSEQRPYVVLVTAFDRYALEAFEVEALDFLVKPFTDARLSASLSRARARLGDRRRLEAASAVAHETVELGSGSRGVRVAPDAIRWVEASGHYLIVHLRTRSQLVRASIGAAEERLAAHGFLRAHRGALVHPRAVEQVDLVASERTLVLFDGSRVPVSRRRWTAFRAAARRVDDSRIWIA